MEISMTKISLREETKENEGEREWGKNLMWHPSPCIRPLLFGFNATSFVSTELEPIPDEVLAPCIGEGVSQHKRGGHWNQYTHCYISYPAPWPWTSHHHSIRSSPLWLPRKASALKKGSSSHETRTLEISPFFNFSFFNHFQCICVLQMHSISVSTETVKFQKRVNLHLFSLQILTICLLCQEVSIQKHKDTAAALRNLL